MNAQPRLEVEGIAFRWPDGSRALERADLDLASGELVGLIGPNGSGKSSFLRTAAGLQAVEKGQIRWGGEDIAKLDRLTRARTIAYLPQRVEAPENIRVEETVALGRHPHRPAAFSALNAEDREAVEAALRAAGVQELRDRLFVHLSGGERQRVLLAALLAQGGQLLLLDEPTSALDLHHQVALLRLLRTQADTGKSILCATHDLNLAARWADRLALMSEGRLVACGTPEEILREDLLREAFGEGLSLGRGHDGRPSVLPEGRP